MKAGKVSVSLRRSGRMKAWLYGLLVVLMVAIGLLAERHVLFLMLLFPIGIGFNWVFFKQVALAAQSSVVAFEYQDEMFTLITKGGSRWTGRLKAVTWNSHWLTVLVLEDPQGIKKYLTLFSDAADADALRALRAWVHTSA